MKTHKVARVTVRCGSLVVVQSHQTVKASGETRHRRFANVSETLEEGEQPIDAAVRGIKEELGLEIDGERLKSIETVEEVKPSPSTREVKQYVFWDYALSLTSDEAAQATLQVDEGDVITHFKWE